MSYWWCLPSPLSSSVSAAADINMNNNTVIEAQGLTKKYGKFVAVDSINLSIAEGEVFGFLGPNGAGKTTTILMLMGFSEPSSGSIRVTGYDPARQPVKVKRVVGYTPSSRRRASPRNTANLLLSTASI